MNIYIGIDNGVTGSIGILDNKNYSEFIKVPTITQQSYTKAKQMITRVDYPGLMVRLIGYDHVKVLIERPMVNPTRFKASQSALRCLEAVLIAVEACGYAYEYIDSKEWQKVMLPRGTKGTPELKKASVDIGCRLFPQYKESIVKHKDADGLLIAEYAKRIG